MLAPASFFPSNSDAFPFYYVGAGAYSATEQGLGVAPSLSANTTWKLRYYLPTKFPSGTLKLRIVAISKAQSGTAKINPQCAIVAIGQNPSTTALVSQGTNDLVWATGDNDKYKELKITLTGITPVVGTILTMDLNFVASGWTVASTISLIPFLIWE